jgi:glycosyltransferase involved in cell wall biosynthesis
MKRIRVLEIIKALDVGGAEILLVERLAAADRTRFDYRVAYLDPIRSGLVERLTRSGTPAWNLGVERRHDWGWIMRLRAYILNESIDVVHVHSPLAAVGVRAAVHSLGRRRPALISTQHSIWYHRITHLLAAATGGLDDLVIAVSKAAAASSVNRYARDVRVLHHGINRERMTQARLQRGHLELGLGLGAGRRVVTVANYRPEKGHRDLVAAAELVHRWHPELHFMTVGQGPLQGEIESLVKARNMSGYFKVLGPQPDAYQFSACADVFVLPSLREGRPVALMEAMAEGVACVATGVGGVPDLITPGVSGLLVNSKNPAELADAIDSILTCPGLQARLGCAAAAASTGFDIVRTAGEIEQMYLEVHERVSAQ